MAKVASGNVLWNQRKRNWCRTPFTFTVYTLTDQELSIKTGVLNQKFNLIKLFRIVDISVERTFLQRLFGMSTLVLNTHDSSSGDGVVKLINIIDGFGVREIMQGAVDDSRRMNGMTHPRVHRGRLLRRRPVRIRWWVRRHGRRFRRRYGLTGVGIPRVAFCG